MRVKRRTRPQAFTWTDRKESAARRSLDREAMRLPLFADQIRAEQPSIEEIRRRRATAWGKTETEWRAYRAEGWREARAALRALSEPQRRLLLAFWNDPKNWLPGDPVYLMSTLHRPPEQLAEQLRRTAADGLAQAQGCHRK